MKLKLSVSIDERILEKVEKRLSDASFRSKSHLIELAVLRHLEEVQNGNR